jgi:acyl transferase domain-containing protein/acyl-CoA synthetase (AMP-forming)/AMP-acid ligase II/thioesterase domain-containing protein
MSIAQWEFEHTRLFGSAIGLVFGDRAWTNNELHRQARCFASSLLDMGVCPGDRVAIALGNSVEFFIACSGASIAGAALVVLGDRLSTELCNKLAHCEPSVLVCGVDLVAPLRTHCGRRAVTVAAGDTVGAGVRTFNSVVDGAPALAEYVHVTDSTLAQLCYTSGSTGTPKAVPYSHGRLNEFLRTFAEAMPDRLTATTVLVCAPPTAFASRLATLRVLANSRYVVLPHFDPERALAAIEQHQVQQVSLLPTMAEQLVARQESGRFDCSSLRAVNIGGSHVSANLVARLKRLASRAGAAKSSLHVAVQYGMTEAGGGIATSMVGGDGVVGRPPPGVLVRIVNRSGVDVPTGDIGEVVAKTPFAPEGYWRDPEGSSQVFRNGYVHTGDLGYFREDGQLCLVGRSKDVIIQGGVNVYSADLIKIIGAIPGVDQCAVVGCPDPVLGEAAIACVVRSKASTVTEAQIRTQCRMGIEPAKWPVRIVFFDTLPSNDAGKVDIRVLRDWVSAQASPFPASGVHFPGLSLADARAIVSAELHRILADVSTASKNSETAGLHTPFGELGLTSQGSVRLAHALWERLGIPVPSTLIYSHPTIEACSEWLSAAVPIKSSGLVPIAPPAESDPRVVAIIGLGIRLPAGVSTPGEFWKLLWDGAVAVVDVPDERRARFSGVWRASVLANVADFDAAFFRLSADAAQIDPRHRQLLEVCWEALENAGIDPTAAGGQRTGMFLGLSGERYRTRDPIGGSIGMAAGYLCHFFDVGGPVVTIDTTCSSSLVALHHAVGSLLRRECDLAIVASANLISEPDPADPLQLMSRDGITRAFDASGSGFGQGEGSLVIVLKRSEDADTAGDRTYAAILGTAINHDGRSSSLTAPNPQSQSRVIALAQAAAGIGPERVQYIEAHGTGTPLGDPIEVEGIAGALGVRRRHPITIGSVKTNIGHLEAAAGLAGVVKIALAIWNRKLPASLHCNNPNPRIPWGQIPVRVQTQRGAWPDETRRLIAGVSSFGMSGTNAHAVLAEPITAAAVPEGPEASCAEIGGPWVLPISASTETALRAALPRWISALEGENPMGSCRDIAYSSSCRRAHLPFRVAVVGASRQEWATALRRYLANSTASAKRIGPSPRKLVLAFSGQGGQWNGMARQLLADDRVFRDSMERCAQLIEARVGWNLIEELHRQDCDSRLNETAITQPVLLAVQISLFELFKSWGIEGAAAVGHSAGEVAAAHAAGLLTIEEAVELICLRGRICGEAPPGGMLAAAMGPAAAKELSAQLPGRLEIAAINGPRSVVLSGPAEAIASALETLQRRGVAAMALPGAHAFHSQMMRSAAEALGATLVDQPSRPARIPFVSGMTATAFTGLNGEYWSRQLTGCVHFSDAVQSLIHDGCTAFLELGPHPVLLPAIRETTDRPGLPADVIAVESIRRDAGNLKHVLEAVCKLFCAGVAVNWARGYTIPGRHVDLPGYAWEHQRYWHDLGSPRARAKQSLSVTDHEDEHSPICTSNLDDALRAALSDLQVDPRETLDTDCSLGNLGIDSLGLLQLRNRLSSGLNRAALSPETTLAELARMLAGAQQWEKHEGAEVARKSPLSWLRRDGADPLYVWVHPAGGGIDCYRPLAALMPNSSITIDSPALYSNEYSAVSVQRLAADYLSHLSAATQSEAIVLGGWSFGGVVAFEMALQLAQRGGPVSQVVLIDSFVGAALAPYLINPIIRRAGSPTEMSAQTREHLTRVTRIHLDALKEYHAGHYEGPVLSLRATLARGEPDEIWRKSAPDLRVHRFHADHFTIMDEGVRAALAAHILRCGEARPLRPAFAAS